MSMTITGSTMGSTDTRHVALREGDGWVVSWLPGRVLSFNAACTAMTIAETVDRGRATPDHREWLHLQGWAAELDMTAEDAVAAVRGAQSNWSGTRIEDLPTNDDWGEHDWRQVFPLTNSGDYTGTFPVGPGGDRIDDVTPERIAEVLHFWATSPEGWGSVDFFTVVRLTDGQYAVSEPWADTTGWGCQADAWWKVGPTYESVIAELSEVNRDRLTESRVTS